MPAPLTLNKTNIQTVAANLSSNDFILMALLHDKGTAAEQTVNSADFKSNWMVEDDILLNRLISLSGGRDPVLQLSVPSVTLTWAGTPTLGMSEAEVKSKMSTGALDDPTFITYAAVLLNKGAAAAQTVNPADYSTPRETGGWGIEQTTFLRELSAISRRSDQNFSIDIPTMTILWLKTVHS